MAAPVFETTPYEGVRDRVLACRNRNRHRDVDAAYLDWRYLGEPAPVPPLVFWLRIDGRDCGMIGAIPRRYAAAGAEVWIDALGDVSLDADLRGRGLGRELAAYATSELAAHARGPALIMPNRAADRAFRAAGWQEVAALERYALPLRPGRRLPQPIGMVVDACLPRWALMRARFRDGSGFTRADPGAGPWGPAWAAMRASPAVLRDRSAATVLWRYEQDPGLSVLHLRTGEESVAVLAFDPASGLLTILDLGFRSPDAIPALLAAVVRYGARRADVRALWLLVSRDHPARGIASRLGFRDRRDVTPVLVPDPRPFNGMAWWVTDGDKDA